MKKKITPTAKAKTVAKAKTPRVTRKPKVTAPIPPPPEPQPEPQPVAANLRTMPKPKGHIPGTRTDSSVFMQVVQKAAKEAAQLSAKAPKQCACGCGKSTKGGDWAPGHRQKAYGAALADERAKLAGASPMPKAEAV